MLQLASLIAIYGVMMFIWTFAYLNRSRDQVNQAFLVFLSNIIVWMILNNLNEFTGNGIFGILLKTVYWLSMMQLAITFLLFVYRIVRRKLDWQFLLFFSINTLAILVRYLFPIDYSNPAFWRITQPVVALILSCAFTLPALFAFFLIIRQMHASKGERRTAQYRYILFGTGLALIISIFSELILPTFFHITEDLHLMYVAVAVFSVSIFVSIMRYRLFSLRADYIYRKLFLNANEGVLIVNKSGRIMNVNNMGKNILQDEFLDAGDLVSEYIPDYRFEENYCRQEVKTSRDGSTRYLLMTQHPIDESGHDSEKLLQLTDVTQAHIHFEQEKEQLLEQVKLDQLTGLYNKHFLMDKYEGVQEGAIVKSLLFIDVDDFKSINDRFGHLAGDKVLRELAACIRGTIRCANDAVRFGGDEFIVVLENTEAEAAYAVAERIRSQASELEFCADGEKFHITLSIGLIEGVSSLSELIEKADRAMYRSKGNGKNRTTLVREETDSADGPYHLSLF